MTIPVLIDCDPGHDDAIAILLALASPEIDLLGITTVAGNSILPNTTINALKVLELTKRTDVPVAAGAARPLYRELRTAAHVHGATGLDGPKLPTPTLRPAPVHAVDFLAEKILSCSSPVTLIPVGPLTNIALLLNRYPEVTSNVTRIVSMGGAYQVGNVTPAAEFNIYVDPEAAHRVYHSGVPVTMIGLEVTHKALLNFEDANRLRDMGVAGRFVAELLDYYITNYPRRFEGVRAAPIHDAVAVAHVLWPDLVQTTECYVTIETQSDLCRGRTVADVWHATENPANASVGVGVDGERFSRLLIERIASLG
jgi:inosine-uridine nucleoside N-ribohydrolase